MLATFLRDEYNNVSRERMYFHKLAFDLQLAAASRNYPLQVFEPEVDRDGFDVVLNDGDNERHIQCKTVGQTATTSRWKLWTRLLRPDLYVAEALNIEPMLAGLGGGLLVLTIDENDGRLLSYRYADYFTIFAIELKLIKPAESNTARAFRRKLLADKDKIYLSEKLLLKAKGPDGLLGLIGLHNKLEVSFTPGEILRFRKAPARNDGLTPGKPALRAVLRKHLSKLAVNR